MSPRLLAKHLKLEWINDIHGRLPVLAGSVRQATLNLLLNACAASQVRGVVQLRATSDATALTIAVGDEGPGIPAVLVDYLIAQTPVALPANDGLGLWIVRRLVFDEGGSIHLLQERSFNTIVQVMWPYREEYKSRNDEEPVAAEDLAHVSRTRGNRNH